MVTKKIKEVSITKVNNPCERCGEEMILTGGGPLGSKDYECMKCHAKMTKGG